MAGSRNGGLPRPAGDRDRHQTSRTADDAPAHPDAARHALKVQCPNPACGKVYAIEDRFAGKKASCPACGTMIPIPTTSGDRGRPGPVGARKHKGSTAPDGGAKERPREEAAQAEDTKVREVRAGCIGRGFAGKTALFRALADGPGGDFLPSGLHVDAADPREVARMIREAEETRRLLQGSGLPPTLHASQIHYCVYDGHEPRVAYILREVIGQVLTHTLPDSAAEQQARYDDYLKSLVNTHALWAVVPCPPSKPGARERRRYANDLRITAAYLREALRRRSLRRPAAVALVLSKIDTLFGSAEEARAALTDEVLRDSLAPLVQLVGQSPRVSDAAVIPVTSFGFGTAVLREPGGEQAGAWPESADEAFGPEPVWLLREGVSPQPFNLDTLFLWTLFLGLLNQAGPEGAGPDSEVGELCRRLAGDLDAADPWMLPLKGRFAEGGERAPNLHGAGQA
jgi:hypothetical protein